MQDQLAEILFYVKGTLKYKWVIIIVAWLICITGWVFVSTLPDQYKSEAKVHVDSSTMLQPLLRGMTIQSSTRGLIAVMQQLMFTRPKLEQVAQLANLDIDSKNEAQKRALVAKLKKGIEISGGSNNLFVISYNGDEPKQAQNIVHAVLTVFSEQTQQRGMNDTSSAQQFIEEQIREYEVRLKNAEKARENFNRVNSGFLPSQGGGGASLLNAIKQQLEDAQMALSEINSRKVVLARQLEDAMDMAGSGEVVDEWGLAGLDGQNQVSTPEDVQIAAFQEQINTLLIRYTENYPDVISIKLQIKDLQERRLETLANMPDEESTNSFESPYIQAVKLSLSQNESEQASLHSRMALLTKKLDETQQGMDTRLHIETEMQNLDRDYSVIKSNYMNLIKSRETAAMTEKAERSQGVLKFKIVEAPAAPRKPTGPQRELLNSAFLGGGLALGLALAFIIYFIRPTFMSTRQVRVVSGLPVLGSVAVQIKEGDKSDRIKQILFWSISASLLLAYIIIMTIA
ncbi:MAG: hypothetical protein GQ583_10300 [Methyloprofundus sp.]|nr:hypothetical protein [Methyloprofundus sp.]